MFNTPLALYALGMLVAWFGWNFHVVRFVAGKGREPYALDVSHIVIGLLITCAASVAARTYQQLHPYEPIWMVALGALAVNVFTWGLLYRRVAQGSAGQAAKLVLLHLVLNGVVAVSVAGAAIVLSLPLLAVFTGYDGVALSTGVAGLLIGFSGIALAVHRERQMEIIRNAAFA